MKHEMLSNSAKNSYDSQRILHDASLIMQGATMDNGRLSITEGQYDYLKSAGPDTIPVAHEEAPSTDESVGIVVLRLASSAESELHKAIAKTDADWTTECLNREGLTEAVSAVTEPYGFLLTALVPLRTKLERNWYGGAKQGQLISTSYTGIERDNRKYQYRFRTAYTQGPETNDLVGTDIKFIESDSDQPLRDSTDNLSFTGGHVGIGVTDGIISDVHARTPFARTVFSQSNMHLMPFFKNFPKDIWVGKCDEIDFSLNGPRPSLILSANSMSKEEVVKYVYDPESNVFILDATKSSARPSVPRFIHVDSFLKALRTTLEIIPTEAITV